MKVLCREDDAAPDAGIYFEKDFVKYTGQSMWEFKILHPKMTLNEEDILLWEDDTFVLEFSASDPYYVLYSKNEGTCAKP